MTSEDCYNKINNLIEQDMPFAIYRIPGENKLHFIERPAGSVQIFNSIESLNGQNGFVIAPFQISEKCPIVLINTDTAVEIEIPDSWTNEQINDVIHFSHEQPSEEYKSAFTIFKNSLLNEEFDKIVLSRNITIERKTDFSPANIFYKACKRYTRSYVYLCHTLQTGTWMGSTPEILLSGKENNWHTVALAGTQPLQNGELPETWDDKNRREQLLVADYIRKQLNSFDIEPEENGPYTVRAGELAHLKSDFLFSLSHNNELGNILSLLHPTPAVCGLPKEKAFQFIANNEGYNRQYYSGFIGRLNPDEQSDLYVNLRCMRIEKDFLTLYAGGGLLASSSLEEEWEETENKIQTMYRIIN